MIRSANTLILNHYNMGMIIKISNKIKGKVKWIMLKQIQALYSHKILSSISTKETFKEAKDLQYPLVLDMKMTLKKTHHNHW